jgi:DNA-binding PucR family transcriptional regulator
MKEDPVPSIHELTSRLTSEVVTVAVLPPDITSGFDSVVVYDPLESPAFEPGDLVLAVGVSATSALALQLVAARPAAVVMRHDGPPGQPLLAEALEAGVALLLVASHCSWSSVCAIATSLPAPMVRVHADSLAGSEVISELFAVANALAENLDAPITIEDNQSRLLAYSAQQGEVDVARAATILGHRVPHAYRNEVRRSGVTKRLLTETEPFFLPTTIPSISARTVVTLREHDEVLGSVWAVTETPLDEQRTQALAEAARGISVRLAHHRLTTNLRRQHREATMAVLLRGGASAIEAARRLGLDGSAFRVAAIAASHPAADPDGPLERYTTALNHQLSITHTAGAVARIHDTVYAVVEAVPEPADSLSPFRRMLLAARTAARNDTPEQVAIGMSAPVALGDFDQGKEEADRVLQVLARGRSHDGCAEVGEVGLAVSMLRLADLESARRAGRRSILDDIDEYDIAHSASYGYTLRVYLASFGDPTAVSQSLGVHTNTLRYRLRRLHELFGLDVTDEDTRFALMIDIRLKGERDGAA